MISINDIPGLKEILDDAIKRISILEFRCGPLSSTNPQLLFDAACKIAIKKYDVPEDLFTVKLSKYSSEPRATLQRYKDVRSMVFTALCHERYGLGLTVRELKLCAGRSVQDDTVAYSAAITMHEKRRIELVEFADAVRREVTGDEFLNRCNSGATKEK